METEILCCILGLAAGAMARNCFAKFGVKKQAGLQKKSINSVQFNKLEKLLHNIESYDGTEKNQLEIGIEEE